MISTNISKLTGRLGALCGVLLAGAFLAGCQTAADRHFAKLTDDSAPAAVSAPGAATAPDASGTNQAYSHVFHPQDAVVITYSDTPTPLMPVEDRIKEDGTITLLFNKTFTAAGKTRAVLEQEVRDAYVPSFFKYMTVTIKEKDDTRFYYVGGEVKNPTRQVYLSNISVLKAIQSAGDFTDFARRRKVVLTRANGQTFTVNCIKAQTNPKLKAVDWARPVPADPRDWEINPEALLRVRTNIAAHPDPDPDEGSAGHQDGGGVEGPPVGADPGDDLGDGGADRTETPVDVGSR